MKHPMITAFTALLTALALISCNPSAEPLDGFNSVTVRMLSDGVYEGVRGSGLTGTFVRLTVTPGENGSKTVSVAFHPFDALAMSFSAVPSITLSGQLIRDGYYVTAENRNGRIWYVNRAIDRFVFTSGSADPDDYSGSFRYVLAGAENTADDDETEIYQAEPGDTVLFLDCPSFLPDREALPEWLRALALTRTR